MTLYKHLEELAVNIGPRPPLSSGEKRASKYIYKILESQADHIQADEFYSISSFSWTFGLILFISILGALSIHFSAFLGLPPAILSIIFFFNEVNTRPILSSRLPRGKSRNITARFNPENETEKIAVITAHYDTSTAGIHFHPKMVKGFRLTFIAVACAVHLVPVLLILYILTDNSLLISLNNLLALYLAVNTAVLLHRELWNRAVPGANDNASGTAVLLNLAEELTKKPPAQTEVWLVATGCEEAGTSGMISFLEKYGTELKDAYFINLDTIGIGDLKYTTGEGMLQLFPCSRELINWCEEITGGELQLSPAENRLMNTDAVTALSRGFKAVSLRAENDEELLPHWHWPTDTVENIRIKNLFLSVKAVKELIKKIDNSTAETEIKS